MTEDQLDALWERGLAALKKQLYTEEYYAQLDDGIDDEFARLFAARETRQRMSEQFNERLD